MSQKVRNFQQFYHDDAWLDAHVPENFDFDLGNAERLTRFEGSHPAVAQARIARMQWPFHFDAAALRKRMSLRRKVLQQIEDWTGWRIGEYCNYKIV